MTSRLEELLATLDSSRRVLILPHNNPDPDSIASAVALQYLVKQQRGITSQIAYNGVIGRAENRALVRYLGNPLRPLRADDLRDSPRIAVVDTQPGIGNSAVDGTTDVHIVIDHHPLSARTAAAVFADVRPEIGATATILTEYLREAGIQPPHRLATALFYGIKTDTLGLVRGATQADIAAYLYLQPFIDTHKLIAIEQAQVSAAYFEHLDATVQAAQVYDDLVMAYIGPMSYPDLAGEMADLLLRLEGIQWSVCMGVYEDMLILSVRTRKRHTDAGALVRAIVGTDGTAGGHGMLAGGQIPLHGRDATHVAHEMMRRVLHYLNISADTLGTPLIQTITPEHLSASFSR